MTIVNKYCSNYENVNGMYIIIDMNYTLEGINYVPGHVSIYFDDSDDSVDYNLSTEELNYLQSISFVDNDGNTNKPHEIYVNISEKYIDFNIYEDNTNIYSSIIRFFSMCLDNTTEDLGYITDSAYQDPNASKPA